MNDIEKKAIADGMNRPNCMACEYWSETAEYDECNECMWNPIFQDFYNKKTIL